MSPNVPLKASLARCRMACALALFLLFLPFSAKFLSAEVGPVSSQNRHLLVSANLQPGTVGVNYNAVITVSGGTAPYWFQAQGLPSGLVLNRNTGGISGSPNAAGQFQFAVWTGDANGNHGLGRFVLSVNNRSSVAITITPATATINSGTTGQFTATVSNSSNAAVSWTVSSGTISSSGLFTAPSVTTNTTVVVTATSVADPSKSATANVSIVTAEASNKVSLEVLFPPTQPHAPYYNDVQTYLLHNPLVSGANLVVQWSSVDQGPDANPQYDWSGIDSAVQQWTAAGKKVNLIVWTLSDTASNTAMPQYIWNSLGSSNYTTCGGQQVPNYFSPAFQVPYQQFMAQVVKHFGTNAGVGYIRFGLGRGGESNPARGIGEEATCTNAFLNKWGWTDTLWINYLNSMLNYEASLKSPKQLMLGVVGTPLIHTSPEATAATAVAAHIGFGSQGLEESDVSNYPQCSSDWCNLFNQYAGLVPLELQTVAQSDPSGAGPTGSLVSLIPFAISHHASIFEIYYQDWLIAFDPSYPGHSQYGAGYAQVLTKAANSSVQ